MSVRRKITAFSAVSALALAFSTGVVMPSAASAQLIGPCPSPLMPPPCIIFDYKKLADLAKEHANQLQKLKSMAEQVKQTAEQAKTVGESIANVKRLASAKVAIGDASSFSTMAKDTVDGTMQSFAATMYGGRDMSVDETNDAVATRAEQDVRSNADAFATASTISTLVDQSSKRLACLSRASTKTTDLRQDWAINSQVRLELVRLQAQKSHLMSVYMQNAAVDLASKSKIDQPQQVSMGKTNPAPSVPARSPAWNMQEELQRLEGLIRSTLAAYAIAKGADTVTKDAVSVQEKYANLESVREQTLARFRQAAMRWNAGHASTIVDVTIAELNRMDNDMAALRERPISQLSAAFKQRNIDAAKMMENDVDPRQFLGTWGDPLKNKNTLDMANGLLNGRLDNWVDGDRDNNEYRDLLLAYNEARLEEAWMRNYAKEAATVGDNIKTVVSDESKNLGYAMTMENVKKRLEELVAQANALGQQIQQTGDAVPIKNASDTLNTINRLLGAQPTAPTPGGGDTPNLVPVPAPTLPGDTPPPIKKWPPDTNPL